MVGEEWSSERCGGDVHVGGPAEVEASWEVPDGERKASKLRAAINRWRRRNRFSIEDYSSGGCGCCVVIISFRAPPLVADELRRVGQELAVPMAIDVRGDR
jgi:hypothetical protein